MNSKIKFWINLFLPIVLGSLVGFIINGNINYNNITRPPLSPIGSIFPIVWSVLYLLMGLSYALYCKNKEDNKISLLYYLQLFVNLTWSIIFFNLEWRFLAIIWIIVLDVLVIILFTNYLKKDGKISTYLLIPYILWILFATYLTIGIYILN